MSRTADVFVVDVGDDENMTSVAWVAAMNELLDEVEAADGSKALVTTSSAPKHFSNGLDTPWMATAESGDVVAYVDSCFRLVHRIMLLGVPTAAAVTGHAFGLGARAVVVGHRYTGPDAAAAGIVDEALPLDGLTDAAIARVAPLAGTASDNLATIKRQLYPLITELVDG